MKPNKILAILMLTILTLPVAVISGFPIKIKPVNNADLVSTLGTANNVAQVNYSYLSDNLLENAHSNYARINATIYSMRDIEIPPHVRAQIQDAITVLENAVDEHDNGNYTGSAKLAHEAVNKFGEALKQLFGLTDVSAPSEDDILDGLKGALARARIYLDKLNSSALRLEEEGYNISGLPELLESAKTALNSAEEYIGNGSNSEAGGALGSAKEILDRANIHLNNVIQRHKERKVEQYINQFSARIKDINSTVSAVSSQVQLSNIGSVQLSLNQAQKNLDTIRSNIQDGISYSLSTLTESVNDIENTLNELNGNGTGSKISEMNRIIANVQVMKNTAVSLSSRGLNTTAVNNQINRTEQIIEEMKEKFADGDLDDIDDLIEDALKKYMGSIGSLSSDGNKIIDRVKQGIEDAISKYGNTTITPWRTP